MVKFIEQVLLLADRYGVKSIVAVAGIYALWQMTEKGVLTGLYGGIGIAIIAVGFFIARHLEHKQELVDPCESEAEGEK